jgi:hypothetical protein
VPGAGLGPEPALALRRAGRHPLPLHVLRRGAVALVSTVVAVNRPATLTVAVSAFAGGKAVWILRSSRVGAIATGIAHLRVVTHASSPAPLSLLLRLNGAAIRPRALYRMTITATDTTGGRTALRVPFRG